MPIGRFVVEGLKRGLPYAERYIRNSLWAQERIIDTTYRKTGLYNRGIVTGIKHGLVGGQIIGGALKLGLAPDSPGNGSFLQPRNGHAPSPSNQARRRRPGSYNSRYSVKQHYNRNRRCSCPSKYKRSRNRF